MKTLKQLLSAKGREVYSIGPDAKVIEALQLMAQKDIGALVVMEGSRVVGMISERDYARKVSLQGKSSQDVPVREIMTTRVVCVAPDGPPQFVWLDNHREQILHCTGPERIETLWWRGPAVRRDYYRIATESGRHLWIFRHLTTARWFLHGEFA